MFRGTKSTPTPLGTYQTMAKYRWKALMGNVWGQYSTRIVEVFISFGLLL